MRLRLRSLVIPAAIALLATLGMAASPASASGLDYQLDPGDHLNVGQSLFQPNPAGQTFVTMESNGDLTQRYGIATQTLVAHTFTFTPGTIGVMQTDGNFVLVAPGNHPVWASGTNGHPGTVLQLQNDGGLALYAPGHVFLKWVFLPFPQG